MKKARQNTVLRIILNSWCFLPVAMVIVYFCYGAVHGYLNIVSDERSLGVVQAGIVAYRRLFLVLGSATILYAASRLVVSCKAIASRKALKSQPWLYLLAALLLWAVVSTLLSDGPQSQFHGSTYRCDGLYSYFIYAAVLCCALRLSDERSKTILFRLFVIVVDILCIIMLLEALHVHPFYQIFASPFASVFNQFNHFGYVLCMGNLCAMGLYLHDPSKRFRVLAIVSYALQIFTLLINDTFGAYLATIVGMIAVILFWRKSGHAVKPKHLVPIAIFVVLNIVSLSGALTPIRGNDVGGNYFRFFLDIAAIGEGSPDAMAAGTGRMTLWVEALKMIPDRPIFGYGPEGLMGDYAALVGVDRPHCELIQYAVFLGIPALILYLAALIVLLVRQWRNLGKLKPSTIIAAGVVVGYFASSLVGNTMFNTAPYFWMMLGFAMHLPETGTVLSPQKGDERLRDIVSNLSSPPRIAFLVIAIVFVAIVVYLGLTA